MAGRLTEEQVTKAILAWLESAGWKIVCYDFPQSGTGRQLHLNPEKRIGKTKGIILPDIVAVKDDKVVFFENKDRYVDADVLKFSRLKSGDYTQAINDLLKHTAATRLYFGIGIPSTTSKKLKERLDDGMIDFVVFVDPSVSARVGADLYGIY